MTTPRPTPSLSLILVCSLAAALLLGVGIWVGTSTPKKAGWLCCKVDPASGKTTACVEMGAGDKCSCLDCVKGYCKNYTVDDVGAATCHDKQ